MLKRRELALGFLVATAIWAIVFVRQSSRQPQQSGTYATSEQHSADKLQNNQDQSQSLWIPTDSIGLYTLVLATFTGLLFAVSVFQGYFLLRADKTARITAESAKRSADAAIAADLPDLIVNKIFLLPAKGEPQEFPRSYPTKGSRIIFDIHNVGRSRGTIEKLCFEVRICLTLPKEPDYVHIFPVNTVVKGDDSFEWFVENFSIPEPDTDEMKSINSGNSRLWVYGFIRFRDHHLRSVYSLGFCTLWYGGWPGGPDPGFYREGPGAYIYKRTEEQN
jgi:hypothetical protein